MLRIIQNTSGSRARSYFSTPDYYLEGKEQELLGEWRGEGAKRLGLSGQVQQKDWDALCDNRHPVTGFPAWLLWIFIHLLYLAQFQNRLLVLAQ